MKDLSATLFWAKTDQAAMELYTCQIHGQQFRQQHMDWGRCFSDCGSINKAGEHIFHKTCMNVVSRPMLNLGGVIVVVFVFSLTIVNILDNSSYYQFITMINIMHMIIQQQQQLLLLLLLLIIMLTTLINTHTTTTTTTTTNDNNDSNHNTNSNNTNNNNNDKY